MQTEGIPCRVSDASSQCKALTSFYIAGFLVQGAVGMLYVLRPAVMFLKYFSG
jgi:hypothetical protein